MDETTEERPDEGESSKWEFGWFGPVELPSEFTNDRGRLLTVASDVEGLLAEAISLYFGVEPGSERYSEHMALVSISVDFAWKNELVPKLVAALSDNDLRAALDTPPKLRTRLEKLRKRRNWFAHGLIGLDATEREGMKPPRTVVRSATRNASWNDETITVPMVQGWVAEANVLRGEMDQVVTDLSGGAF